MKHPFNSTPPGQPAFDISGTIDRALAAAGLPTASGPMLGVTETIRRALASAGIPHGLAPAAPASAADDSVIDVTARFIDSPESAPGSAPATNPTAGAGQFVNRRFGSGAASRAYKLYVPAQRPESPPPLLVMLHGCTQSADDFAAGTQMNRLADAHGFLVVYPEQAASANPSKCWNWFNPHDQQRGSGEPALIAGITREVAAQYGADPRRIFVAGLSAGAAMAVVMGESYPELFAGVGAHSGLAYGAAHDIPSAMAAMKGGRGAATQMAGMAGLAGMAPSAAPRGKTAQPVPTIVFHGDRDHTVQQSNGAEIVAQAMHAAAAAGSVLHASATEGHAARGRAYSRTVYADAQGRPQVESWVVHGAGHAWFGGDASGSYTEANGPDASAEMFRFFAELPSRV